MPLQFFLVPTHWKKDEDTWQMRLVAVNLVICFDLEIFNKNLT